MKKILIAFATQGIMLFGIYGQNLPYVIVNNTGSNLTIYSSPGSGPITTLSPSKRLVASSQSGSYYQVDLPSDGFNDNPTGWILAGANGMSPDPSSSYVQLTGTKVIIRRNYNTNSSSQKDHIWIKSPTTGNLEFATTNINAIGAKFAFNSKQFDPVDNANHYQIDLPNNCYICTGATQCFYISDFTMQNTGWIIEQYLNVIAGKSCTTPGTPTTPTILNSQCGFVTISSVQPPSGQTWYWQDLNCNKSKNFGSGSTFLVTQSGTYYLQAYNPVGDCWSNNCASISVTVKSSPQVIASSNSPANAPISTPNTLNLAANTIPNATYIWSGPNGYNATGPTPTRPSSNTTMSGEYCVTVTSNGCSNTDCTDVLIVDPSAQCISTVSPPGNLTITNITSNEITLKWDDNSNNENKFELERSLSQGVAYSLVKTLSSGSTMTSNSGLDPNKTYYYRVRACCNTNCSNYSSVVSGTTTLIDCKPKITLQPPFQINDYFLAKFELEIIAEGNNLLYQWRKNNIDLKNTNDFFYFVGGVNTNHLVIDGARTTDSGDYSCIVMNNCGNVISETTHVVIKDFVYSIFKAYNKIEKNEIFKTPRELAYAEVENLSSSKEPIKICADGTKSTYIEYENNNANIDLNNIMFKIKEDTYGFLSNTYGYFDTPTNIGANSKTRRVYLNHPILLESGKFRTATIQVYDASSNKILYEYPLEIYRAPLMFLHGIQIWGGVKYRTTFDLMINNIVEDLHLYPGENIFGEDFPSELVYRKVYDPSLSFRENFLVVYFGINELLEHARSYKYSAGAVDIIAHSMGGVLTRLYLQSSKGFLPHPDAVEYRNDIHKFIAVNTPNEGSHLATALYDGVKIYDAYNKIKNLPGICSSIGNLNGGFVLCSDALSDLRVGSDATNKLLNDPKAIQFQFKVPTHIISSDVTAKYVFDYTDAQSIIKSSLFNVAKATYNVFESAIFLERDNDLAVSVPSQLGGISSNYDSHFQHVGHSSLPAAPGVCDFEGVWMKVVELLNANPFDNNYFTNKGFNPERYAFINNIVSDSINHLVLFSKNDSVKIIKPLHGLILNSGSSIDVSVVGTKSIIKLITLIGNKELPVFIKDTFNTQQDFKYKIPQEANGTMYMMSIGVDSFQNVYLDTLQFDVTTNSSIDSISTIPREINLARYQNRKFNINGYFHDGIQRDITYSPELSFTIIDTSIYSLSSPNLIYGKNSGSTYLVADYKGKKAVLNIHISDLGFNYLPMISSDKNVICQSDSIQFNNETLGEKIGFCWLFPGGSPSFSKLKSPIISYSSPGIFDIKLVSFTPIKIDTLTLSQYIKVNPNPKVDLGPDKINTACSSTIDAKNSGAIYQWNSGELTQKIYPNKTGKYIVTVTDVNGCKASDSIIISVMDNIKPTVITRNYVAFLDAGGNVTVTPDMINKGSYDNCGIASLSVKPNMFNCKNKGVNKVILTVYDVNGNSSTGNATVTVMDLEPPRIVCPPDISVNIPAGQCSVFATAINLGNPLQYSDNCAVKLPITNNKSKTTYSVGVNTVVWTVTDSALNVNTCNQYVSVVPGCNVPKMVLINDSTSNSAKIKWQTVNCSLGYEVAIKYELTPGVWGGWSSWSPVSGPGLIHQFAGLKSNKYYCFQLRTKCGSAYSENYIGYFHTKPGLHDEIQNRSVSEGSTDDNSNENLKILIVPNPSRSKSTIYITGFECDYKEVSMYDMAGRNFFQFKASPDENQFEMDFQRISIIDGTYIIRVASKDKLTTNKIVIIR